MTGYILSPLMRESHLSVCLNMLDAQYHLPDPGGRLPNGSLYADPLRFPSGLGALSASVSRFGVRLGAYTARGRLTCMGRAGSLHHEEEDMRRFAVDWNLGYEQMRGGILLECKYH